MDKLGFSLLRLVSWHPFTNTLQENYCKLIVSSYLPFFFLMGFLLPCCHQLCASGTVPPSALQPGEMVFAVLYHEKTCGQKSLEKGRGSESCAPLVLANRDVFCTMAINTMESKMPGIISSCV